MTAPAAPATAQVPTVELWVELPSVGDPWDLVVALAEEWDLPDGAVDTEDESGAWTVTSENPARSLSLVTTPNMVRLRLLVTAPDTEARAIFADALDDLAAWAEDAGVVGWRWMADGCAGWHCGDSSCLLAPPAPRPVARWRRVLGFVFGELAVIGAHTVPAVVALCALARWEAHRPLAGTGVLGRGIYDLGDLARGVPLALAAYAAGRVLLAVAALFDPPDDGLLAEVRDAAGPVVLAVAGALLGWGWLR